ncbi:MAG: hypothetical protein R3C97_06060 [Geminicoccaceae bacterium]
MSATPTHTSPHPGIPSPRALFLLAHHVEEGREVAEAARLSGVDAALAGRLMRNWAFLLLVRIVPFFRIRARRPSASTGEHGKGSEDNAGIDRIRLPRAARWAFSVIVDRECSEAAETACAEDASTGQGLDENSGNSRDGDTATAGKASGRKFSKSGPSARHGSEHPAPFEGDRGTVIAARPSCSASGFFLACFSKSDQAAGPDCGLNVHI